jgi:hypothetical protein
VHTAFSVADFLMLVVASFQLAHFSIQILTAGKGIGSVLIGDYSEKRQKQTVDAKQCQPIFNLDFRWVLSLHLQAQNLD